MKILKAKLEVYNKKVFDIKELTYIDRAAPLKELLNGEDMIDPIQVLKHEQSKNLRLGANGVNFFEKKYSVWKGSQRIQAAIKLGYTHIEGVIINE